MAIENLKINYKNQK